MSEEQQTTPIRINEILRFSMFTDAPGVEGKRSRLAWSVRDGNPRVTVYTNIPTDTIQKGVLSAPMNPETFFIFLDLFEKVALGDNGIKYKIDCYTSFRKEDGTYTDKTLQSELWFGKDDQGVIWISVNAPSRPKIKFDFKVYDYHKIYKGDGTQISESEASALQALAVIKAMRNIYVPLVGALKQPNPGISKPFTDQKVYNGNPATAQANPTFEDVNF